MATIPEIKAAYTKALKADLSAGWTVINERHKKDRADRTVYVYVDGEEVVEDTLTLSSGSYLVELNLVAEVSCIRRGDGDLATETTKTTFWSLVHDKRNDDIKFPATVLEGRDNGHLTDEDFDNIDPIYSFAASFVVVHQRTA